MTKHLILVEGAAAAVLALVLCMGCSGPKGVSVEPKETLTVPAKSVEMAATLAPTPTLTPQKEWAEGGNWDGFRDEQLDEVGLAVAEAEEQQPQAVERTKAPEKNVPDTTQFESMQDSGPEDPRGIGFAPKF